MTERHENDAREAIRILDQIVASNDKIRMVVDKCMNLAEKAGKSENSRNRAAQLIIAHYSNLCAMSGGASGLPGMIPFVGPVLSIFGAGALDAVMQLKFEIEMVLALSVLAGRNIDDPKERKIAYLMACTSLEDAYNSSKEPTLKSIVDLALGEYSTRELTKTMVKAVARVIMMMTAKKWTKYFPIVGIMVGVSMNKILTEHTGRACWRVIKRRAQ